VAPLYIPFVKIVHASAMRQFDVNYFIYSGAIRDDEHDQSITKQKATKIDIFYIIRSNDKSKAICIQPYIIKIKFTAEDAPAQIYPAGGFGIKTWNDIVQYQILMDALSLRSKALVELSCEFIKSCKTETIVTTLVANGTVTIATYIPKQDITNFLLVIPFAANSSLMEERT
jgi:hypothetical protein